jgi:hypothetical protein
LTVTVAAPVFQAGCGDSGHGIGSWDASEIKDPSIVVFQADYPVMTISKHRHT